MNCGMSSNPLKGPKVRKFVLFPLQMGAERDRIKEDRA